MWPRQFFDEEINGLRLSDPPRKYSPSKQFYDDEVDHPEGIYLYDIEYEHYECDSDEECETT